MIRRVNVPVTSGAPTDRDAWWNMPKTREEAHGYPIVLPHGAEWIAIDPGTSSPHVSIAADLPGCGLVLLTPGAPFQVSTDHPRVLMHNPVRAMARGTYPSSRNGIAPAPTYVQQRGRVSLLTGRMIDLPLFRAYSQRILHGAPKARAIVLAACPLNSGFLFPTLGLTGLRIHAVPGDVGGMPTLNPANFSVSLRKIMAPAIYQSDGGTTGYDTGDTLDVPVVALSALYPTSPDAVTVITPVGNGPGYIDVPITTPSWASGYEVTALAGDAVVTAIIGIEGY